MSIPSLMRSACLASLLLVGASSLGHDYRMTPLPGVGHARVAAMSGRDSPGVVLCARRRQPVPPAQPPQPQPDPGSPGKGIEPRQQPLFLRVVTWNVHPTSVNGESPDARIDRLITFAQRENVDLMALQEVPLSLFRDQNRLDDLSNAVTQAGYELLAVQREYPTGGRAPVSARQNAYAVIYDPNVLTPVTQPANDLDALEFVDRDQFVEGAGQGRPPVSMRFNVHHPNGRDSILNLLVWHNEAGTSAAGHVTQLEHYIDRELVPAQSSRNGNPREDWLVVGDFNVIDTRAELQSIDQTNGINLLTHGAEGIDHILTNMPLNNVINDDPLLNIDPQFRSRDRHLALFGEFGCAPP